MQIFLMWPHHGEAFGGLDPEAVARRLKAFYEPLFADEPATRIIRAPHATVVYLELPVAGWLPPYAQQDATHWALALDYPIDADRALREVTGEAPEPGAVLPALGRALERDPAPLLERLAPPFALAWSALDDPAAPLYLQGDGLGFGQLFEYRQGGARAYTNRLFALKALGVELKPVAEEWAAKCTLGWFPLDRTGYAGVRALPPGARVRVDAEGAEVTEIDVLTRWVHPGALAPADALELGFNSLRDYLHDAARLWERASAGLTGGWDSRAVAALLLADGIGNFHLRTRGDENNHEVLIASRLAELAGAEHVIQRGRALPPPTPALLRRSLEGAIRWQAGHMDLQTHKGFLRTADRLGGGDVNIMGQHGEIGRGFYLERVKADRLDPAAFEDELVKYSMTYTRSFLRPALREAAEALIREAYRAADRYGLEGADRLDFFYLNERTRRWASGGQYAQPGKVVAPFLSPRYIQAAYAIPAAERVSNPFHRYTITRAMPRWAGVPYGRGLDDKQARALRKAFRARHQRTWLARKLASLKREIERLRHPGLKKYAEAGRRSFDNKLYWHEVGEELIGEVLAGGGLWTEIYDPDRVRAGWDEAPDDLAILYFAERLCE